VLLEDLDDLGCHFVHIALHTNPAANRLNWIQVP